MKKLLLAILVIGVISLAGCGKKDKTTTVISPDGTKTTTVTSPEGKIMSIRTQK